jgi:hypothetical protein
LSYGPSQANAARGGRKVWNAGVENFSPTTGHSG